MKKLFFLIIIGFTWTLCGCAVNDKVSDEDVKVEVKSFEDYAGYGTLYSVNDAYQANYIDYKTLLSIAYYQNKGREQNEVLMIPTYTPIQPDEKIISIETSNRIRASYSKNQTEFDACRVYDVFGVFDNVVVCKVYSTMVSIPAEETYDTIDGVHFIYPSQKISVWIEDTKK